MEERKFVCKYCSKRFPCGKSLGGHIRTHMTQHPAQHNDEETSNVDALNFDATAGRTSKRDLWSESEAAGNSIYGLRENPKKTMRFADSVATLELDKFCKECGKVFPSLKALCGHMACHSEKEKGANKFEGSSGLRVKHKLVIYTQSDIKTSAPTHPRTSKRMRFKTQISNQIHPFSSVSEVEQEKEEVARCLMMLSQDSSHRDRGGHFASVTESASDNNSVVLEAKSPSVDTVTRVAASNGKNFVSNAYEIVEKKPLKDMKLKSGKMGAFDNSGSGYFRYGLKKVQSEFLNEGFCRNHEFKTPKVVDRSGFYYDVESGKMVNRGRSRSSVFKKLVFEDLEYDRADRTRKRANCNSLIHHFVGVSSKKTQNGFSNGKICENGGKGCKYECLGNERDKGSYDFTYESHENCRDTDSFPAPKSHNHNSRALNSSKAKKKLKAKKRREHKCPICYKIFQSGQALGGHKRSHVVGGCEENALVIKQGAPAVGCLVDLNLPAPVDE